MHTEKKAVKTIWYWISLWNIINI